jgi:DNA replication and repair protein RecF
LPLEDTIKAETSALVRGTVKRGNLDKDLQIQLTKTAKSFYINGKREIINHYLGQMDVVIFSAEELAIVRGEPSERRRFLDRGIVGLTPNYLKTLAEYNRILKQKNSLLKGAQEQNPTSYYELLDVWNAQLVAQASIIHQARQDYVARLQKFLDQQFFSEKSITMIYQSGLAAHGLTANTSIEDYRWLLSQRLTLRREQEIAAGYALIGPHRDEVMILQQGQEISRFGSAGEQRSALITLDLAQMEVYNCAFEEYPIFLIDDIDAELDHRRISLLLDHVAEKMQVFVSTSKSEITLPYRRYSLCNQIRQGAIIPVKPVINELGADDVVADVAVVSSVSGSPFPVIPATVASEMRKSEVAKNITQAESISAVLATQVSTPNDVTNLITTALPTDRGSVASVAAIMPPVDKHRAPF